MQPAQEGEGTAIVLFAYDRPDALSRTIDSLNAARETWKRERGGTSHLPLTVSLDGPRQTEESRRRIREVREMITRRLPDASVHVQPMNRGLPTIILETLTPLFATPGVRRAICIEDDVEFAPTLFLALETLAESLERDAPSGRGHVIGAAPKHRDGSVEHQALLIDSVAHRATVPLLREYIDRFQLDGAAHDGAYGRRDHGAIAAWATALAVSEGLPAPTGTSQDRMRELAWRRAGVSMLGTPMRLVRHRGLWGQHNTPWYALRTGQLFQRVDQRPWSLIKERLVAR